MYLYQYFLNLKEYFIMKIVVLKFGGTSVGTIKKIKKVAKIIAIDYKKKNYQSYCCFISDEWCDK